MHNLKDNFQKCKESQLAFRNPYRENYIKISKLGQKNISIKQVKDGVEKADQEYLQVYSLV